MSDWEHTRKEFEDVAFMKRFMCGITKNPHSPFFNVDCPTQAEFVERDEEGEYKDTTLQIMWWAWKKAMIEAHKKSQIKPFFATFGGMYLSGHAVILADDKNHAETLLKTRMEGECLGSQPIYSLEEIGGKLPCVPYFDNGDY